MSKPGIDLRALPPEVQLTQGDDSVTLVFSATDSGDAFALAFLGVVALLFCVALGTRALGWPGGTLGGVAVAAVPVGLIFRAALARVVDKVTIVVKKGELSVSTGPVQRGTRTFGKGDVSSFVVRQSEHRSATRGGQQTLQRTWSLWALLKDGKDCSLLEPLPTDAAARQLENLLRRTYG